ncbi:hypothetical protein Vafri_6219 [Volvox africanus]|uniref:Uncharacterized protein n=1 Tax=Volvox africanus TaxID=51714 RepID=A0A8J4AXJ9_9CHLO|nr:hypothetical protein Vafri_6219 [Volvox africanus]
MDNVGAHYWRDRAAKDLSPETTSTTTSKGGGGPYPSPYHHHHHQPHQQPHQPLALSLFEMHAAIAARLSYVSRRHRLPVVASKTAAVTAKGLPEGGGGGGGLEVAAGGLMEGEVQLQQREFMPITWQNVVTHRLLLYPRGAVVPRGATPAPTPRGKQPQLQSQPQTLTAILAEMLGAVGQAAAASGAPASVASGTAAATEHRVGGSGSGSGSSSGSRKGPGVGAEGDGLGSGGGRGISSEGLHQQQRQQQGQKVVECGTNVILETSAAATAGGSRPLWGRMMTQLLVSSVAMVEQW